MHSTEAYFAVSQQSRSLSFADRRQSYRRQFSLLAALPEPAEVILPAPTFLHAPRAHFYQTDSLAHDLSQINNNNQVQKCFQTVPGVLHF